ncbi:MAG TPA: putative colanic acid biosynthesis acetyltransferase [Planctomycetaceae bacterium]|nr:putative colanic acid biosynthesis acetyltransferase [Planctomycetaceae bacterium]
MNAFPAQNSGFRRYFMTHSPDSNPEPPVRRRLADYSNAEYHPGRGFLVRLTWYFVSLVFLESAWLPWSGLKVWLLRLFGARIGAGVVIHPNVRVKNPWRLSIDDNCWIGREVWIDNIEDVTIESDVCLSQQAYLCTGSHDHHSETFELTAAPIRIGHGAWICCRATVLPGAVVPGMRVVGAGRVFTRHQNES